MLTLAVLLQTSTARGYRLTQLAKSYVWYGRNEPEKGKETERERESETETEQRKQQLLIQTNLLLLADAQRPFCSAVHRAAVSLTSTGCAHEVAAGSAVITTSYWSFNCMFKLLLLYSKEQPALTLQL